MPIFVPGFDSKSNGPGRFRDKNKEYGKENRKRNVCRWMDHERRARISR